MIYTSGNESPSAFILNYVAANKFAFEFNLISWKKTCFLFIHFGPNNTFKLSIWLIYVLNVIFDHCMIKYFSKLINCDIKHITL